LPGASLQAGRAEFAVLCQAILVAGTDYSFLLTHGRDFYGTFAAHNTPDHTNLPNGVHCHRKATYTKRHLLDMTGTTIVPSRIKPFLVNVPWPDEEDDGKTRFDRNDKAT
jgi:hypothetical protein